MSQMGQITTPNGFYGLYDLYDLFDQYDLYDTFDQLALSAYQPLNDPGIVFMFQFVYPFCK